MRLLLLLVSVIVIVSGNVTPAEYNALVDFYNAMNGPKWTNQSNWLNGDPCENTWFGVGCRVSSNAHVIDLDLTKNNLNGSIPNSIANLFDLDSLVLTVNNITSTIPTAISALRALTLINLSHNSLSGSIPDDLGNLVDFSLVSIDFSYNDLTGTVPEFFVTDQSSFQYVDLSNNNFLCPIPAGAEYTQATCIQVNISYTTTDCFNNPFASTDILILGSGFDTVNGIPLECMFQMGGQSVNTSAIVASPTQLYCHQPVFQFLGCNGLEYQRMVAFGTVSIGTMGTEGVLTPVSNSLTINILNTACPYGNPSTTYAQVNGVTMYDCPRASFPLISDAIDACSHGNGFPYRCPTTVTYNSDGDFSEAVFDPTCNTTLTNTNCLWAPLISADFDSDGLSSDTVYCPYYDPNEVQSHCVIPSPADEWNGGTFKTAPCLGYTLSSLCPFNPERNIVPVSQQVKDDLLKLATVVDSVEQSVEKSVASVFDSIGSFEKSVAKKFSSVERSVKKSLSSIDSVESLERKMVSVENSIEKKVPRISSQQAADKYERSLQEFLTQKKKEENNEKKKTKKIKKNKKNKKKTKD